MVRPAKRALPLLVRADISISHSQAAGSDDQLRTGFELAFLLRDEEAGVLRAPDDMLRDRPEHASRLRPTTRLLLANTGSLGSPAASPAVVLAQAFAAHGVRVAPYVREQQPVAPGRRHSEWVVVVSGTARLDEVIWPRFGSDRHTGLSRRRPSRWPLLSGRSPRAVPSRCRRPPLCRGGRRARASTGHLPNER